MDSYQLWRDVRGGLIQLTLAQWQAVGRWARSGGSILAVGDIIPLLLAWQSGAHYTFVGTAKSEYYLQNPHSIAAKLGGIYFPWERWLLRRSNCKAVFPRDRITTQALTKFGIPAFDLGNPMMDGLTSDSIPEDRLACATGDRQDLRMTLLPGSRAPEAYQNWSLILQGLNNLLNALPSQNLGAVAAVTPSLDAAEFLAVLRHAGWQQSDRGWIKQNCTIQIWIDRYRDALAYGDLAIAMAGTATEQFVGLGKPAIIIPGQGPQFTRLFAERQTYLLGESVILVDNPQSIGEIVPELMTDTSRLQRIKINGLERMGAAGAAAKIANCLLDRLI